MVAVMDDIGFLVFVGFINKILKNCYDIYWIVLTLKNERESNTLEIQGQLQKLRTKILLILLLPPTVLPTMTLTTTTTITTIIMRTIPATMEIIIVVVVITATRPLWKGYSGVD